MRLPSFMRPGTGVRTRLVFGATFAFALAASVSVWAAFSGAIYTSLATGTRVNQNLYDSKDLVYLNGGPQNLSASGLPDGVYFFFVTDPSGATLLSTDQANCRQLMVVNGVVAGGTGPCPHASGDFDPVTPGVQPNPANGSIPVQLIPFLDTPSSGGEYKVWLVPFAAATIGLDGITLTFDPGNKKTDNFKVKVTTPPCEGSECPCDPECPPPGSTIAGEKFYDANANGVLDSGEVGIPGWLIQANIPSNTTTDANGNYSFLHVADGIYSVCEVIPALAPTWINTTPTSISDITVPPDSLTNNFGNVCLGSGGGLTLGYWHNKNGNNVIKNSLGNLSGLNGLLGPLNIVNAAGQFVVPFASLTAFDNWIVGATANNMANMLSAQVAAMKLNVASAGVSGTAILYAGTCGNSGLDNKFITVDDLIAASAASLGLHPITIAAGPDRDYQECLKNALDNGNNNKNFVQSSPCAVNYSGLETSCLVP
jgi:hypothetical protein